jgi:hypothetical protein
LKALTKAKRQKRTSVSGQALGYFLRETKMTELLVKANQGDLVSLVVLDDVAVESQDGHQTLIQSKNALITNRPPDRVIPFWKTLANWAEALDGGLDFSKRRLVIYVSNPRTGKIAEAFHQASTLFEGPPLLPQRLDKPASPLLFAMMNIIASPTNQQ